jgi:hypothetical protein
MEINFNKETVKTRLSEISQKAKETANSLWEWAKENREDITAMIPVVLGVVGVAKAIKPQKTFGEMERERKDHEYWNPHNGHRFSLKRKPTNYEWCEISRRESCGEDDYKILRDLGLI